MSIARIEVVLTPAEIALLPATDLSDAVCVVFDVLRATSTIVTALANGARRVFPAVDIDEALAWKRDRLPAALLGGERRGVRIDGFEFGNSPREYTRAALQDRDIISTTTNGTIALRACAGAGELHAGALLNLDVLATHLRQVQPKRLLLVCAGSGRAFSLEDALAAGALLEKVAGDDPYAGRDAGQALRAITARFDFESALAGSYNGRALTGIGLGPDVDWCARLNACPALAVGGISAEGLLCLRRPAIESRR